MKKGILGLFAAMLMFSCSGLAKEETLAGKSYILHVEKSVTAEKVEKELEKTEAKTEKLEETKDKKEAKKETKKEESKKVKKRERGVISISFNDEDFYGSGGVNRYFGKYEAKKGEIKFSYFASTRMMGDPEMMEKENNYFETLSNVTKYEIKKDSLLLITDDGETLTYDEVENEEAPKDKK